MAQAREARAIGGAAEAAGGRVDAPAGEPVVTARDLLKRYNGVAVVDGIDLEVRRGECFGLLGPNGAGKTTALRMMLGHTPPDGGLLEVLGEAIPAGARRARQRIGLVPQLDNLDPDFSVRENLQTYASYFGLRPTAIAERIGELIRFAALEGREAAPIPTLSGGMKRRLTLARALINRPELVVLDEPTTGLDPQARQHIWERLRRLLDEGRTLILTTHYMEEAERLCDRVAIIDHGRIVVSGPPARLIAEHLEPWVLELRGAAAAPWLAAQTLPGEVRAEVVGDTGLLYARRQAALEAVARRLPEDVRHLHRPAGLEDVFLRLTGRELRD